MTPKEAAQRMLNMMHRPKMYAMPKEGYYMQHWVLLEAAGVPDKEIREFIISLMGNAGGGLEPLDDNFLDTFNTALLNFLEEKKLT